MKVYLYSGAQKVIEKSGVGRAIYHQKRAAAENNIEVVDKLDDADLIHINTYFPKSYLIASKAHRLNIPVVYHAHSTREDFRNSFIGSNIFDGLFCKWITACYNKGDIIITPTDYSKQLIEAYGIEKEIKVVSNGIDLNYYNKSKVTTEGFREKYGYSKDDKIIMCVGLTIERKGVADFVELARRMPEYKFIWFGYTDPKTIPASTRKIISTKLPNLIFAGYCVPDDLRKAYAECDLFLFTSKEETEGIVVLEALAMKIPILLRDIDVYAKWLRDGEEVYKANNVEEFEDKIRKIINGELKSLADTGYQAAEERSLENVGKKLKAVYEQCIDECQKRYSPRTHIQQ